MARERVSAFEHVLSERLEGIRSQLLLSVSYARHVVRSTDTVREPRRESLGLGAVSVPAIGISGRLREAAVGPLSNGIARNDRRRLPAGGAELDGGGHVPHRVGKAAGILDWTQLT